MSNKVQGIILLFAVIVVLVSERFSTDFAILFAAGVLVIVAIWDFIKKQTVKPEQERIKQEHLQKVLGLAKGKEHITNDDVQYELGVSDKTAERYLHELVGQGKLEQIGESGRGISYRIK